MVPAPTASDLPKKERRLMELFEGLTLSLISYSPLFGIFFIFWPHHVGNHQKVLDFRLHNNMGFILFLVLFSC